MWTTLLGLRVDGEVVVGVADAPALGERVHATRGGGAWRGTERLAVSTVEHLEDAFVMHVRSRRGPATSNGSSASPAPLEGRGV